MTYRDQWGGGDFTSAEIDQLVRLAFDISRGVSKLDARKYSRNVRRWLERWHYAEKTRDGFMVTRLLTSAFGNEWLPVEALWRIVAPMLGESRSIGHSIRRNRDWAALNLFSADQHLFSPRDEHVMYETLALLAQFGYVYFQAAGSVWETTERKDAAA